MHFGTNNIIIFVLNKRYVLEHFSELPGRGIIKKKLNYDIGDDPIFAVINPQGVIMNENARKIIFEWGIDAFPFRISDAEDIFKKWEWFWKLLKKVDINIEVSPNYRHIFKLSTFFSTIHY